jgi:hypothetical protein
MNKNIRWRSALWAVVLAGAFLGLVGAGPVPAYAQKVPAVASAASPPEQDIATVDAQRGALDRFLDAHPEIESEVIGNPEAMSSPNYLHRHPELQAFLESHPLVKADPRAFLSRGYWRYQSESQRSDLEALLNYFVPASVVVCFLLAFLWVIRTVLENRRWNRSFKMHEELHSKLIEKFASGQDFNAYLQSDGGRRLLEWAPPETDTTSRGLPNPVGRILWSLQAGIVLLLVGLGLIALKGEMAATDAPPLLVFGTLGLTLGIGFILSALASYGLTKHLGLINGAVQGSDALLKR